MKLAIFDLDGTLVDSMGYWRNIAKDFLNERDISISREVENHLTTLNLRLSLLFLIDYYKLNISFEEMYELFNKHIIDFYSNKVNLKDNALEILKYLKDTGLDLVIGTSTNLEYAQIPVKKYGFDKYIEDIYTVESQKCPKNDPNFYKQVCDIHNVSCNETLLIDDSYIALRNAKKSGLITIGIYDENSADTWTCIQKENPYSIKNLIELKNL